MPFKDRDVLWFSDLAFAMGDLQKIPKLILYKSDKVDKINKKIHDQQLVNIVVA